MFADKIKVNKLELHCWSAIHRAPYMLRPVLLSAHGLIITQTSTVQNRQPCSFAVEHCGSRHFRCHANPSFGRFMVRNKFRSQFFLRRIVGNERIWARLQTAAATSVAHSLDNLSWNNAFPDLLTSSNLTLLCGYFFFIILPRNLALHHFQVIKSTQRPKSRRN